MSKRSPNSTFTDHDDAAGIIRGEDGTRSVEIGEFDLNNMHPFDIEDVQHGVKIFVVGKPGTGKSSVIEQIMLYKSHICPISQIMSGTESNNHFFGSRSTDITVFSELDLKAMEGFAKRQNIATEYLPVPWGLQILDDVTDDQYVLKKKPLGSYYRKGRHWRMIHINAAQYPMDIPAGLRTCIDYIFIGANSIISERQKLYENFAAGSIPSYEDFSDLMDQLTENQTFLVIDNTIQSSKINERVFFFRSDLSRVPKGFKLGCKDAFDFDAQRRNPHYKEDFL